MTLVKFKPSRSLRLYNALDPWYSGLYHRPERHSESGASWSPRIDVVEKGKEIELRAELPGIEKKNIELTYNEDVLTIRGEKEYDEKSEKDSYFLSERAYGKFERSFRFGVPVDDENIKASYENGVLTVVVPKSPKAEPEKISIK